MPESVSLIIPVYNEEENIRQVIEESDAFLKTLKSDYEIIVVDDGSIDGTGQVISKFAEKNKRVKQITFQKNCGKTEAIVSGFKAAKNDVVVMMDGDCQFTARDIPKFMEKIREGYDVVNGWGVKKEPISKIIASFIFNFISKRLWHMDIRQFNIGYKAFRKSVVKGLEMKKDEHRYMLPILKTMGYKIGEVKVEYFYRTKGVSKYTSSRFLLGVLDMIALKLRLKFLDKPMRFFGTIGFLLFAAGIISGAILLFYKLTGSLFSEHIPLTLAMLLFILTGIQLFSFGFLAEVISTMDKDIKMLKQRKQS